MTADYAATLQEKNEHQKKVRHVFSLSELPPVGGVIDEDMVKSMVLRFLSEPRVKRAKKLVAKYLTGVE